MTPFALLVCTVFCVAATAYNPFDGQTRQLINELRWEMRQEFELLLQAKEENLEQKLQEKEENLKMQFHEQLVSVEAKLLDKIRKQGDKCHEVFEEKLRNKAAKDSEFEIKVTELKNAVDILGEEIFLIDSRLTANLNLNAALISQLSLIQEEVLDLGDTDEQVLAEMNALGDRFSQLENALTETRIESLEQTVRSLDLEINNLNANLESARSDKQDIDRRMDVIETNGERYSFLADLSCHVCGSGVYIIVFDRAQFNRGGVYDPTTGVFKAPSDGVYHFNTQLYHNRYGECFTDLYFYVNGESKFKMVSVEPCHNEVFTLSGVADLQLRAGDEVTVWTDADEVYGGSDDCIKSSFSGFLIEY